VAPRNDQLDAGGTAAGIDETDPDLVLSRIGSGTTGALFTHEAGGSSAANADGVVAVRSGGLHAAPEVEADDAVLPAAGTDDGDDGNEPPTAPKPASRWRKPALIGVAALVCVLAIAGGTVATLNKTVTISVDGVA